MKIYLSDPHQMRHAINSRQTHIFQGKISENAEKEQNVKGNRHFSDLHQKKRTDFFILHKEIRKSGTNLTDFLIFI